MLHFTVKFDQLFVQRLLVGVTINLKLADIKLENSEAYLPKLEKNLSLGFEIIDIFCKNAVLNICRYLKRFYTYQKIKIHFLKVRSFFIKDAKNHGNRLNHSCLSIAEE